MKTYRIGILGLHHDHIWPNLEELAAQENAEIVAAADPNKSLLAKVSGLYGCAIHENYATMLDEAAPDAVYVYGNNKIGAKLASEAARRGLHVMIEKPMAADLAGANDMLRAANEGGIRMMINWPFSWWPHLQKAIAMAGEGLLGRLWQVKYRAAHQGPKEMGCSECFCEWLYDRELNGAGALMDYCCYGAILARVLLGRPASVTGIKGVLAKRNLNVEDNAILVLSYPKALATSEASWTQIGKLTAYTTSIFGEEGTLVVEPRGGGRLLHASLKHEEGIEVPVAEPEPHMCSASAHFLWGIETGQPFNELCETSNCRDSQEILEAGIKSADAGATVSLG